MGSTVGDIRKLIFPLLEAGLRILLALPYFGAFFDMYLSFCSSLTRLFIGAWSATGLHLCKRPVLPLILYQYEGCPFCRRVREALCVLKINVIIYPCPRTTLAQYGVESGSRYRGEATRLSGGKCMFPILVDPNEPSSAADTGDDNGLFKLNHKNGRVVIDSAAIVSYLWTTYGDRATMPWNYALLGGQASPPVLLALPSLFRLMPHNGILKDTKVVSKVPTQLLELYSCEACPGSRLVRERLDCIEIPYLCINDNPAVAVRDSVSGRRPGTASLQSAGSELGTGADGSRLPARMTEKVVVATPTLLDRNEHNEIINNYRNILLYIDVMYTKKIPDDDAKSGSSNINGTVSMWATYSTAGATADNYVLGAPADRTHDRENNKQSQQQEEGSDSSRGGERKGEKKRRNAQKRQVLVDQ